ncbi:MAG: HIT family protein [Perlucidibaca sp.]
MTVFAKIIAGELPAHFVHMDEVCVAFMDINPMSPGHVLVVPRQMVATLAELDASTRAHLMEVAVRVGEAQRGALGSQAQHLLVNDGKGASQTVPHVHVHVIPRYPRDAIRTMAHILWHVTTLAIPRRPSVQRMLALGEQARLISAAMAR